MSDLNYRLHKFTRLAFITTLITIPLTSYAESATVDDIVQTDSQIEQNHVEIINIPMNITTSGKDVKATLVYATWRGNELGLSFKLTTTSPEPIDIITLEGKFFDDNGQLIKIKELPILRASKGETQEYLTSQEAQGRQVWVKGINKEEWTKHRVQFTINQAHTNLG